MRVTVQHLRGDLLLRHSVINFPYKRRFMDQNSREKIESALELVRSGSKDGVEQLYCLMGRIMLFVANGVLHDIHSAEDVVQDSFVKIVRHIGSYRRGTNGYAWVCRIVRNTALNYAKSTDNRRWTELSEFDKAAESSFDEKSDTALLIEKLMNALTPERREMVYMKYFLDMTVREIGKELRKSKSYVAKEIRVAEEEMKKNLG